MGTVELLGGYSGTFGYTESFNAAMTQTSWVLVPDFVGALEADISPLFYCGKKKSGRFFYIILLGVVSLGSARF